MNILLVKLWEELGGFVWKPSFLFMCVNYGSYIVDVSYQIVFPDLKILTSMSISVSINVVYVLTNQKQVFILLLSTELS